MPTPEVSVIVNCLNGEAYLREALDSVLAQTYTDWEVVFWDNASTDATGTIAKSYGDRVRYFRSGETHPLGKARNLAIQQARGRYLAFLDSDDLWFPRKLEKQVAVFDRSPRLGFVYCDTIFFDAKREMGPVYGRHKPPRGMAFRELLGDYFLSLETVVVRREALESLPEWFDERFNVVEEKDLFLRLAHDYEIDCIDEPLAKWRVHEQSWTHTHYDLFSVENTLLLEKLRARYPELDVEYVEEVRAFTKKIAWQGALAEWKAGHPDRCRELLRPYASRSPRMAAAYALSYLGTGAFNWLSPVYMRYRRLRPGRAA